MNTDKGALEARLTDLGARIDWPTPRDLSGGVRYRIQQEARPARRTFLMPRTALALVVAGAVLIAASLALFPGARQAIADWLGISGVQIRVNENLPTPTTSVDSIEDLDLGKRLSLSEAQASVEYPIRLPARTDLGEPMVFLRTPPVGGAVSLVYPPGSTLPRTDETGVGMLITEFEARLDLNLVKKISAESTVEPVEVGDGGYWLGGNPHAVMFIDSNGRIRRDEIRLAANTLLWEEDGVSYRIESELEREETLAIARSME